MGTPGSFSKVVSHIGSFVNIRGGYHYPSLIRKTERKPLRVFLQEGMNDLDNIHGNWPLANKQMEAALRYMNYDYRMVWGVGEHNARHAELQDRLPPTCAGCGGTLINDPSEDFKSL